MKVITGDILNEKLVLDAMQSVDVVIHCAALTDISLDPDEKAMQRTNVDGTTILLNAAIECNVPYFVYVSTADVVIGPDQIYYGSEATTPIPAKPVMGPYAVTKRQAEVLVIEANNKQLSNGGTNLRTVVVRPTVSYGEGDVHFIPNLLRLAKENKGVLQRIDNIFIRCQVTYAGNVAWAIIKAKDKMRKDASIGGEVFFVTDDSPILDPFDFFKPFLEMHSMRLSSWSVPYWILMLILGLIHLICRIARPVYRIEVPESWDTKKIRFICNTYFFNRNKSILRLDYDPIYSADESMTRALKYYRGIKVWSGSFTFVIPLMLSIECPHLGSHLMQRRINGFWIKVALLLQSNLLRISSSFYLRKLIPFGVLCIVRKISTT